MIPVSNDEITAAPIAVGAAFVVIPEGPPGACGPMSVPESGLSAAGRARALTFLSAVGILVMLYLRLFTTFTVPGISAVICLILGIGGAQFIILGLLGEYIGRIFEQGKHRPLYIVASSTTLEK